MDSITIESITTQLKPLERYAKEHKGMIGTAIGLTLIYRVFRMLNSGPPKRFKGLPYVTTWDIIKSIVEGNSIQEHYEKYVNPVLDKAHGLYVQPLFLGWQLRSANPRVNKLIMSDMALFPKHQGLFGSKPTLINKFLGGRHIGVAEGDEWRRHRKVVNPAFHRALPVDLFGQLTAKSFVMMDGIGLSNLEIVTICSRMTLDAIGIAGFGFDFEAITKTDSEWAVKYTVIKEGMSSIFYALFDVFDYELLILSPKRRRSHKALDQLLEKIDDMVDARREEITKNIQTPSYQAIPDSQKDILTLMIEAELQGEGRLTNEELRRNVVGFFMAGHDTTSNSLAFILGQLARAPEVQKKAREEVLNLLGDEPEDVYPTTQDVKNMPYLDAIIKETLRLNPPISNTLVRIVGEDMDIEGVPIEKGSLVDVDAIATHLSSKNWENPKEFIPERFLGTHDPTSAKDGVSWIPFGYGSHHCLGMNFSLMEQRVFLSMFLRKYEWVLPEDSIHHDYVVGESLGLIKPRDLKITFKKRY